MKNLIRRWWLLPVVAVIVIALDQWSKAWVERAVPVGTAYVPVPALGPFLRITHLTNTGAAFGFLRGQGGLFVVIAIVVVFAVLVYARYLPANNWLVRLCLGLQLGGAISNNLLDRLQNGHVTDWVLLSVPWQGGELQWPAFNVADSAIVVSVIVLAFVLLRAETATPSQATDATGDGQAGAGHPATGHDRAES